MNKVKYDEIDAYNFLNELGRSEGAILRNMLRLIDQVQAACIEHRGAGEVQFTLKILSEDFSADGTPLVVYEPILRSKQPDIKLSADFFYVDEKGKRHRKDPAAGAQTNLGL